MRFTSSKCHWLWIALINVHQAWSMPLCLTIWYQIDLEDMSDSIYVLLQNREYFNIGFHIMTLLEVCI